MVQNFAYLSDLHFALQDIKELRQSDTPVEALGRTTELDITVRGGGGGRFKAIRTQNFHSTKLTNHTRPKQFHDWQSLQGCKGYKNRSKKHRFRVYKKIFRRIKTYFNS